MVASKSSGSSGDGWKIRCQTNRTLPSAHVVATIAVLSCLTLASTPISIGSSLSATSGVALRIDAGVPFREVDEAALRRDEAVLDQAQILLGPQLTRRISSSHCGVCHGAIGSWSRT